MYYLHLLQPTVRAPGIRATKGLLALREEYADMSAHAPIITKDIDAIVGIIMF